jgi:predicted O-methyltransferase YrrM
VQSIVLTPGVPCLAPEMLGVQSAGRRYLAQVAAVSTLRRTSHPLRVLEIGSWLGASALTWAHAIDRFSPHGGSVLCVDAWRSYFSREHIELFDHYRVMHELAESGEAYRIFLHNASTAPGRVPVGHLRSSSDDAFQRLAGERFDLIYIDGAHDYRQAVRDILSAKRLVADGGLICGDDLELQLGDYRPIGDAEAALDYVMDDAIGKGFHPGVTRAVHEALGRVSVYDGFWVMRRAGETYVPVDLNGAETFIPPHLVGLVEP